MISDTSALEALEEIRDQSAVSVPTELLQTLLTVETQHMFSEHQDVALRLVEGAIDAYLSENDAS